ncbi:MAG: NAD(+) synthase [Clostridiaceae bacterium]
MIDYNQILNDLTTWTAAKMKNAGGSKAVLGISGGKDSSVTAALMVRVLGADNVIGVMMPDKVQADIDDSQAIIRHLGISAFTADIGGVTNSYFQLLEDLIPDQISRQTRLNLPPRVRMTLLYAISQSIPQSLVINTSNISEDWVGYATIYGDTAGAFSPLGMLTTEDVIEIGRLMGIPDRFLVKPPSDGLTGKTDEAVLGVTYSTINRYIRTGEVTPEAKEIIDRLHRQSRFKFLPIPMFDPTLPIVAKDLANVYNQDK